MSKYKFPLFFLAFVFSLLLIRKLYSKESTAEVDMKAVQVTEEKIPSSDYIEDQISELNTKTPIDIIYNEEVLEYISYYLTRGRRELQIFLGRSRLYFPVLEEILDQNDLPFELKYMAVIESGLNPLAVSGSGATGLWQLKLYTGKMLGLNVTSYVDERRDPYLSTRAASLYLKYLYRIYGDWILAIAAYNGGPGEVRNAVIRSGDKTDYWEIRPYMSEQVQNYIPKFIAVCYLMNYSYTYNLKPIDTQYTYSDIDSVRIDYSVSFEQIADNIDISGEKLSFLNPVYKLGYIPAENGLSKLVLPVNLIPEYLRKEEKIKSELPEWKDYHSLKKQYLDTEGKDKIVHIVKQGEFCHIIALRYDCTVESIKKWNNLTDDKLFPGQKLNIWIKKDSSGI